jgi:hypothetical protein
MFGEPVRPNMIDRKPDGALRRTRKGVDAAAQCGPLRPKNCKSFEPPANGGGQKIL